MNWRTLFQRRKKPLGEFESAILAKLASIGDQVQFATTELFVKVADHSQVVFGGELPAIKAWEPGPGKDNIYPVAVVLFGSHTVATISAIDHKVDRIEYQMAVDSIDPDTMSVQLLQVPSTVHGDLEAVEIPKSVDLGKLLEVRSLPSEVWQRQMLLRTNQAVCDAISSTSLREMDRLFEHASIHAASPKTYCFPWFKNKVLVFAEFGNMYRFIFWDPNRPDEGFFVHVDGYEEEPVPFGFRFMDALKFLFSEIDPDDFDGDGD